MLRKPHPCEQQDEEILNQILEVVSDYLRKHGFTLKQDKCEFVLSIIEYFGHVVNEAGLPHSPLK